MNDKRNLNNEFGSYGRSPQTHYGETTYGESRFGNGDFERGTDRYGSTFDTLDHFTESNAEKRLQEYDRSDERIREDVRECLFSSHEIDASDIEVSVNEGCVTLSGTVENLQAKKTAEILIENIFGIEDVKNELRLNSSSKNVKAGTPRSAGGHIS